MHDSPGSKEEQQLAAAEAAAADVAGAAAKDLALLARLADGDLEFEPLPDDAMPEGLTPQASHDCAVGWAEKVSSRVLHVRSAIIR
jgi:Flp pilus assembly protein CpaB